MRSLGGPTDGATQVNLTGSELPRGSDWRRDARAIAIAVIAWFGDGGPTHCSSGQSTAARPCAAIWLATSRGLVAPPIFVTFWPRAIRSQKSEPGLASGSRCVLRAAWRPASAEVCGGV